MRKISPNKLTIAPQKTASKGVTLFFVTRKAACATIVGIAKGDAYDLIRE
jgi:hypothetical protein